MTSLHPSAPGRLLSGIGLMLGLALATPAAAVDLLSRSLVNKAAYIPSQCYTNTIDIDGEVHNPCYSCHQASEAPNYSNDDALQLAYDFAAYAEVNRWSNLFVDRSAEVAAISDDEMRAYINVDNYRTSDGRLILADRLGDVPAEWDYNGDGQWSGFIPDCWFDFDAEGFDRDPNGVDTGWRAFGYYPFLGTFWPTNGSTDDVLIRLPEGLRQDDAGDYDRAIYKLNLAIVEALIKRQDVAIEPTDEAPLGVDLDKDGQLGTATQVTYDWAPLEGRTMSYVGRGKTLLENGEIHLAAGLYPEGTSFLHSVRYVGIDGNGDAVLTPRMKELRYGKKLRWVDYSTLDGIVHADEVEKWAFPDRLRTLAGDLEHGMSNGQGWVYQGFIEDADGQLRPQTYEETAFCIGCHGILGGTTDTTFAFPRKLDASHPQQGWMHWSQHGLRGVAEPLTDEGEYEYTRYLRENGAGDEFRANAEIHSRFFNIDGSLRPASLEALHQDLAVLLYPSPKRAMTLNKAYWTIVREQSFVYGRDATLRPPLNVHVMVPTGEPTGVASALDNDR